MKLLLTLFFISLAIVPSAYAERVLPKSNDCPIAKPFTPEPKLQSSSQEYRAVYPMGDEGYKIKRIQISTSEPVELEIIWTAATWDPESANVSVSSNEPQCFFTSPEFPVNVPAQQIEIRAQKPVKGLTVSFSDLPWDYEGTCSAKQICPTLVKNMNACKLHKDSEACDYFIDSLHDLASEDQCRRSFDTEPVPAAWVCDELERKDESLLDEVVYLLRVLKSEKAKKYYKSKEFRSAMSPHIPEEYDEFGME